MWLTLQTSGVCADVVLEFGKCTSTYCRCSIWLADIQVQTCIESTHILLNKERKMVNFKLGKKWEKWNIQFVPSMGQRKNLSPRQESNPWAPVTPVGCSNLSFSCITCIKQSMSSLSFHSRIVEQKEHARKCEKCLHRGNTTAGIRSMYSELLKC